MRGSWLRSSTNDARALRRYLLNDEEIGRVALIDMGDESLLRLYDSIRAEVDADRMQKYKFTSGDSVRQRAEQLRSEIIRRRLPHTAIDWYRD